MANLKIGNLVLGNNLVLAPMAGVNDVAFRILCHENGCGLVYTGMISSDALLAENRKTLELAQVSEEEGFKAIQVFGNDPFKIAKAISLIERNADVIDINMGCPDKKINEQGSGGALLDYPEKIGQIVKAAKEVTSKPLTIKIRCGTKFYDENKFLNNCKIIQDSGADALIIHPRTVKQKYMGHSDWNLIKLARKIITIPIIGNGDVKSLDDSVRMQKQTGCDAVMIGRAAIGNPFIFNSNLIPEKEDICDIFLRYLELCKRYNITHFAYLRMQALYFFKHFQGSKEVRVSIAKSKELSELKEIVNKIKK